MAVRSQFWALLRRTVRYILIFHYGVFVFNHFFVKPETVPSRWTCLWQVFVGCLVAESGFYWAHRLLHTKYLYYWHKRHHE